MKEFGEDNPKLSELLMQVLEGIEQEKEKYIGQDNKRHHQRDALFSYRYGT